MKLQIWFLFTISLTDKCRYNRSNTLTTTVKKKSLIAFIGCEVLSNTNIYPKHVHTEPIPL